MNKLNIQHEQSIKRVRITMMVVQILSFVSLLKVDLDSGLRSSLIWILISILGFVASILVGKSKFLTRILARVNDSEIIIFNNLFGLKINVTKVSIDSISEIDLYQDIKRYYKIDLKLKCGSSIELERFPIKKHSVLFQQKVIDLLNH